jgi:hypothetical protein
VIVSDSASNPGMPSAWPNWLQGVAKIHTSNEEYYRLFRQALEDMAALRLPIETADRKAFLPAAGLPWFVAPFGRDSLIASLQNILIYPQFARDALDFLGSLQATEYDPYRDAEPGKIFHELRYSELAHFKLIPQEPRLPHACSEVRSLPERRGASAQRRDDRSPTPSSTAFGVLLLVPSENVAHPSPPGFPIQFLAGRKRSRSAIARATNSSAPVMAMTPGQAPSFQKTPPSEPTMLDPR